MHPVPIRTNGVNELGFAIVCGTTSEKKCRSYDAVVEATLGIDDTTRQDNDLLTIAINSMPSWAIDVECHNRALQLIRESISSYKITYCGVILD